MIPVGFALRNFSLLTGVSRCVAELARRLPAEGFAPFVAARRLPAEPLPGVALERVLIIPLNSFSRAASFDWFARRRLARRGVRLVHGQGDLTRQDVLTVNNCDAAAARHVPDGRRVSGGVRYVRDRQFPPRGCRLVIANSDMVRRDVCEFYGVPSERVRRVYFGVDLERFHPRRRAAARSALLSQAGWPPETEVALMVLSGDPAKRNFSLAARAADILARERPLALCLAGNLDWRGDPSARALHERGRLHHVPLTPRVEDFYAAADVFLLPAFYEEFGLTVLESLASGCPAVVSGRCGAAEVLGGGGSVFTRLDDPEELMENVRQALALDRALPRAAAELFPWERHVREIAAIYRELL